MTAAAVAVRERPILFSGPMVRAILDGRKTQTRRVVRPQPTGPAVVHDVDAETADFTGVAPSRPVWAVWMTDTPRDDGKGYVEHGVRCPLGRSGDRLWVRESGHLARDGTAFMYRFCGGKIAPTAPEGSESRVREWKACPSIHMPRWASRLTLEITDVRVERVQAISEADARAEGIWEYGEGGGWKIYTPTTAFGTMDPRRSFASLWDAINAARGFGWDANPWVWAISFRRLALNPARAS